MQIDLRGLVQRVGKYRRATFTAPRIDPTAAQRTDLLRLYMRVVRGWQERFRDRILPAYERSLSQLVTDDANDLQFEIGLSDRQMAQVAASVGLSVDEWIKATEDWHRRRFAQAFNPTGVNIGTLLDRGDVTATLQAALGENVALIRSLNDQMRNDISGEVFRALQSRTTARDLARAVRQRAGVGQSRAELIAADQLQKLTGALDEQRQRQVGIGKFAWAHSGKANPREEHKARDGNVYSWNDPVAKADPPGRAIRCGCRARAVLEIDEEVETGAPPEPSPAPAPPVPVPVAPPPPRGFRSPRVESLTLENMAVRAKAEVVRALGAQTAEAAADPRYDKYMRFKPRKGVQIGETRLPSSLSKEGASLVAALKPEIDAIADRFAVPRLRQISGTQSSRAAGDMGDGGLGVSGTFFSDVATSKTTAAKAAVDEAREAIKREIVEKLKPRYDAVEAAIAALPAKTGPEYAALARERQAVLAELAALRKRDEKLWREQSKIERGSLPFTPTKWTPENDAAPPENSVEYFESGVDQARTVLYHEMGHHVHQFHKRKGPVREFGLPPVEREISDAFREARQSPRANFPSKYSATNEHEWFAENFALYTMGRPELVGPVAKRLIERILNDEI